ALFGLDMAEPATAKRDLVTARGAEVVADQAKSPAKPPQATAPVRIKIKANAKTKTKRQTAAPPGEPQEDRKSRGATQPAATSGARTSTKGSTKAKSTSDKAQVGRKSTAGSQAEPVVEAGDAQAQRKRRSVTSAQPGRTRAAKWIGGRARRTGA